MRLQRSKMKLTTRFFIPMAVAIGLAAAVCTALALQNSSQHQVLFEKAKFTMETKAGQAGSGRGGQDSGKGRACLPEARLPRVRSHPSNPPFSGRPEGPLHRHPGCRAAVPH